MSENVRMPSVGMEGNRFAVLSDIHSNHSAFQACFEDAVRCGADGFIFLGDYLSDLAEPQETMDLVYHIQASYPTVCLRGNREGYLLDCESGRSSFVRGSKSGSLLFTYERLRKQDLAFFRGLKIADTVEINGVRMEIAHATMENDRYYFDSQDGHTAEIFAQMKCRYLLTGHSHRQYVQQNAGKTIINPGSVGIPHGGTPHPKYALLVVGGGDVSCTFREVPYDIEQVIHTQFASGLADDAKYWAIGVLYDVITGDNLVMKLLQRVQDFGDVYDEEAWRLSALALGMKLTEREIVDFARGRLKDLNEK